MMNGPARNVPPNMALASAGLTHDARLRGTKATLAAAVCSPSVTTATSDLPRDFSSIYD